MESFASFFAIILVLSVLAVIPIALFVSVRSKIHVKKFVKKTVEEKPFEPVSTRVGKVADAQGFEYMQYRVTDRPGHARMGYARVVPTTYPFTCPDCGGMVVGVGAARVRPGTTGPDPTAFRCEKCGREESTDFGVPRVVDREGEISFDAPRGVQAVCPRGGKHEWELLSEWEAEELPPGVDGCLENLCLVEQVWHQQLRCTKCGEEKHTSSASWEGA